MLSSRLLFTAAVLPFTHSETICHYTAENHPDLSPAPAVSGDEGRVENMKPLYIVFRPGQRPGHMEHV